MNPMQEWLAEQEEIHEGLLKMDGYDDCIVGITERFGQESHLTYDYDRVIAKLVAEGMTEEDAVEFYEFNQLGAWVGDRTPSFIRLAPAP